MPFLGYADKKAAKADIEQIKTYIKSGKDFDKAEELARKVMAMPEFQENMEIRVLLADCLKKQYEAKNMQLYLKTLKDTASVFPVERRMFLAFEGIDSLDMKPDKKGNVHLQYRKKDSDFLCRYRPNLLGGARYSIRHKDYNEAWECVDTYLDCERQPLFSAMDLAKKDTMRYDAAVMAVFAARQLHRHDLVEKYATIATMHPMKARYMLVELYDDALQQKDTTAAVGYLHQGFNRFPEYGYFFPRLVDYYMAQGRIDTVKVMVNRALEVEPGNLFYRLALNILQLNTGKYDECISLGDSLIHNNDKMATAYFNVGSAYYNKAIALNTQLESYRNSAQTANARKVINEQKALYEKSRPYLERYRLLRPKETLKWAPLLYNIYLNLNMGDEFDEIEKIWEKEN